MASPAGPEWMSREATPSSSCSTSAAMDQGPSSNTSIDTSNQSQLGVDKFLKRMEMEKTMHALQTRLKLASVKATNGWTDMSIGEIETHLPPTPFRNRSPLSFVNGQSVPPSPQIPYEPPSPSRPWQLIDVLWQPLPPPSHSRLPASPESYKKRSRDYDHPETPHSRISGHRRASSSVGSSGFLCHDPHSHSSSPLHEIREGEKKRRAQSHSHHPSARCANTTQDVNAAKALTSMLGSASASSSQSSGSSARRSSMHASLSQPIGSTSLPLPLSPESGPPRPRASSFVTMLPDFPSPRPSSSRPSELRTPSSHTRSRIDSNPLEDEEEGEASAEQGEDDKTAAELMMFLAHSPSPMKRVESSPMAKSTGGAARVLFAETSDLGNPAKVIHHSNLALARPITADNSSADMLGGPVLFTRGP